MADRLPEGGWLTDLGTRAMTYLWCGEITARRCYALRCNASAGWRTGSHAGTSSRLSGLRALGRHMGTLGGRYRDGYASESPYTAHLEM